jgi:hypothetical protein
MWFATTHEMEYLDSRDRVGAEKQLITEASRQLDALRRFDQYFCDADWRPQCGRHPGRCENSSKDK